MNILVTGGCGFIGSHTVVELVKSGYNPIIIDNLANSNADVVGWIEQIINRKLVFYQADCADKSVLSDLFDKEKIDGVIHFAADKAVGESVSNPLKYYRNNINTLISLMEIMEQYQAAHLVFSSSCTVYGQPDQLPVCETSPIKKAESPYGNTKQICEQIIIDAMVSGWPADALILRYFNPIGAHPSGLIGELPLGTPANLVPFITQTAIGMRNSLSIFGNDYATPDGTCLRDYIHVCDLAAAHVTALDYLQNKNKKGFYDIFNIGTGKPNSVLEVIQTFQQVSGQKLNYTTKPRRNGDVEQVWADVSKAKNELGWQANLSLSQALLHAWQWQQQVSKTNNSSQN